MTVCAGCERPILDRFLLNVLDRAWHAKCVQCADCLQHLTEKCFSRDGKLYCRDDFFRRYGTKCGGCSQGISPNDLVRRARNKVFHLKCFTCLVCRKQLSTGEELYVLEENKFICKEDYITSKYAGCSDHEENDELDNQIIDKLEDGLSDKEEMSVDGDDSTDSLLGNTPVGQHHQLNGTFNPLANTNLNKNLIKSPNNLTNNINNNSSTQPQGHPQQITPVLNNQENKEQNNNSLPCSNVSDSKIDGSISSDNVKDEPADNESISGAENDENLGDKEDEKGGKGSGTKRRGPRTTIKAKQLELLKAAFATTPKPTRHIREQLAQETGLNMRVIQVWFQNRRSKERRMKQLSALGARRHFFRNPRMRRSLRPGEMDDNPELLGQPGFNYPFGENGEFYGGYGYPDFFPGGPPGDPNNMNYLPPNGPGLVDQNIPRPGMGPESQFLPHDMMPQTSSPEPLPPHLGPGLDNFGTARSLPSNFAQQLHQPGPQEMEAW